MRKIVLYIVSVVVALITAGTASAAGFWDQAGIDASRAGIPERQSTPFIEVLTRTSEGEWKAEAIEDRQRCDNYQPVLQQAVSAFRSGQLDTTVLEGLVKKAGMPSVCLMEVFDSFRDELVYTVLVTPAGDFVFGYDEHAAYTPWSKIDHVEASFDAITLDQWTTLGIAPAGQVQEELEISSSNQPDLDWDWLAQQAKEHADANRLQHVPIPTPRPDTTTTGSIKQGLPESLFN